MLKKYIWRIVGFLFLIIGGIALYFFPFQTQKFPQVCCNEYCFTVEIAQTPEERQV